MTPAERLDSLFLQYQEQGTRISIAEENGLFAGSRSGNRPRIEAAISSVEAAITAAVPAKIEEELFKLQGVYYATLHAAGLPWRLVHVYGLVHIFFVFLGAFAAARVAETLFSYPGAPDVMVLFAGIGGATLRGLYFTIEKANEEFLRRVWILSSAVGPFVGMLLAVFLYYSFAGGLAVFSESTGTTTINQNALIWVCLFAGLKWQWAMDLFDILSKKIK